MLREFGLGFGEHHSLTVVAPNGAGPRGRPVSKRSGWVRYVSVLAIFAAAGLHAETGYNAWLRYAPLDEPALTQYRQATPAVIVALSDTGLEASARNESIRGIRGMLGRTLRAESAIPKESAIVLGTLEELRRAAPQFHLDATLAADGYWLKTVAAGPLHYTVIAAANSRGVLYGAFALLRKIPLGESIANLDEKQSP